MLAYVEFTPISWAYQYSTFPQVCLLHLLEPPTILCACAATVPGFTRGSTRPVWMTAQFMRQKASAPWRKGSAAAAKVRKDFILSSNCDDQEKKATTSREANSSTRGRTGRLLFFVKT